MAAVWKRHREDAEKEASAAGKRARFTKLDLTAIILAKQLRSKHEVLEYAQKFGCQSMQQFVSNKPLAAAVRVSSRCLGMELCPC